jgi:hypothetical protein
MPMAGQDGSCHRWRPAVASCHERRRPGGTLSSTVDLEKLIEQTSEKVRSALEAAKRRADEIVREAESDAQRIRAQAEADARQRLDQVRHALEQLEAGLGERAEPKPKGAASSSQQQPVPVKAAPEPPPSPASPSPAAESDSNSTQPSTNPDPAIAEQEPETSRAAPAQAADDDGGAARLVAMKLALDGTPREEAREQLAADYKVNDLDALLDQVYAKAGK